MKDVLNNKLISTFYINDYIFQVCTSVDQIIYSEALDYGIERLPYSKDITEDTLENILKEADIISKTASVLYRVLS